MDNAISCLKNIISEYENNNPNNEKVTYTVDDFKWIEKFCNYTVENNELQCINKYDKKFLIGKTFIHKFIQSSTWKYKYTVITNFCESKEEFYINNKSLIVRKDGIEYHFVESISNVIYPIKSKLIDSKYTIQFVVTFFDGHKLNVHYDNMELVLQNFNDYIYKLARNNINKYSKYVIDFKKIEYENFVIKIIGKIKPKFNNVLLEKNITETCKIERFRCVYELLKAMTQEVDPLEEKIYRKTKTLHSLIEKRNDNKETKKNYEQRKNAKTNYDKCMEEIKKFRFIRSSEILSCLYVETKDKLTKIWDYDTYVEFKKNVTLTSTESSVVEYLYTLGKNDREKILLSNEIYL